MDGGAATAAQTIRMDQLLCRECAEVVFIHVSMACGRLVLRFRPGEPVGKLESTLTAGKSLEIIQNGQILLCGVLRRRKLC